MHVLDDGFQHLQLDRDIDLVIVGRDDVAHPVTLPAGRLREPLDTIVAADAILAEDDVVIESAPDSICRSSASGARRRPIEARPAPPRRAVRSSRSPASRRPQRFFDDLRGAGWIGRGDAGLPDHHRFSARDIDRHRGGGTRGGRGVIVTTEKDYVRLLPFRPLPLPIVFVPITLRAGSVRSDSGTGSVTELLSTRGERPWLSARRCCATASSTARSPAVVQLARLLPMPVVLGGRHAARHRVLSVRSRRTGGSRSSNLQAAFPLRSRDECRAIARGMFAHFGRLLTVLLKFSTMRPEQMLARVEFEGEERVRRRARARGAACCCSPGTSASGRSTRWCTR